jgi:hypothetical protein
MALSTSPTLTEPEVAEAKARRIAAAVLRNLIAGLFSLYPQIGMARIQAIVESAARGQ